MAEKNLYGGISVLILLSLAVISTALTSGEIFLYLAIGLYVTLVLTLHLILNDFELRLPGKYQFSIVALFLLYFTAATALSASLMNTVLALLLSYVLLVVLYIFPVKSTFEQYLHWIAVLATAVGLIGLLSIIIGDFSVGPISVRFYDGNPNTVPGVGWPIPIPQSIFGNPNGLGHITAAGALASLFLLLRYQSMVYVATLLVTFSTLYATVSRSGLLVFILGIVTFVSVRICSAVDFDFGVRLVANGVFAAILLVMISIISPTLSLLQTLPVNFTNRILLWDAAAEIIRPNWLTGIGYNTSNTVLDPYTPTRLNGLSPHSSYVRVFIHTGIIGGGLYIATQYSIVQYISRFSLNSTDEMLLSFTLPLVFLQLFETFSILGFAHQSIMTALALGYAIQRIDRQNSDTPREETNRTTPQM